ncbi:TraR/DksA family transcriptional regulator [Dietzia sp.]|uniref:TraR/DksA family transcriptional regulator n=1 Tax=Dietzia sp. TaxID=1871616 RepID=UPI002FDA3089
MPSSEHDWRVLLAEERGYAQSRADALRGSLDALVRKRRNEADDDEHDPDGDSLSSQWSMLTGLLESTKTQLHEIDGALNRVDEGTFGICSSCGTPIPEGQLMARPFRALCVDCASKRKSPA